MNKDYYFSHDYNPTTDPKIQAMFSSYGDWGYGIFWRIIEMMHRENDNAILLKRYVYASFAQHKSTSVEQVEAFVRDCISEFELFISDGVRCWSDRVKRNIGKREEIIEKRSKAGKASAEARKNATSVEHVLTSVEHIPTKERKTKEKKTKGKKENNNTADAGFALFWDSYGKKKDKEKVLAAWSKIPEPERTNALGVVEAYVKSTPDVQFRKNPLTWLNGKCWNDELAPAPKVNGHQPDMFSQNKKLL